MRTEKEILDLVLDVARRDERVRVVGMNGSRVNPNVPKDDLQDYDVAYVVTDMRRYLDDPAWIDVFGPRIILQTPEAMELFPPELGNWFSYLMLFEDGTRIDLLLVPLDELDKYIHNDKLVRILLDKDGRVPPLPPPSDADYRIQKPTIRSFDDCCNEFWWLSAYVAKGLCRNELPYAVDHLSLMRQTLFQMLSWQVGIGLDFSKSMGKNYKYLGRYLAPQTWARVTRTYRNESNETIWDALWTSCDLFRQVSGDVAERVGFVYPDYDAKMTPYLHKLQRAYGLIS